VEDHVQQIQDKLAAVRARVIYFYARARHHEHGTVEPSLGPSTVALLCSMTQKEALAEAEDLVARVKAPDATASWTNGRIVFRFGSSEPEPGVAVVFAHWQAVTGKAKAELSPARAARIARHLRWATVEHLCRAIDGMWASDWHQGKNPQGTKYLGIKHALKDRDAIDAFAGSKAGTDVEAPGQASAVDRLACWCVDPEGEREPLDAILDVLAGLSDPARDEWLPAVADSVAMPLAGLRALVDERRPA
jgi:hypothetical protein